MKKALIAGQKLLYQGGDQPRFSNGATMLTEMHFVASPPALEESPGDGGASKRPSGLWVLSTGGKYRAAGSYRKDWCVEQVSVLRTWYVLPAASQSVANSRTHGPQRAAAPTAFV